MPHLKTWANLLFVLELYWDLSIFRRGRKIVCADSVDFLGWVGVDGFSTDLSYSVQYCCACEFRNFRVFDGGLSENLRLLDPNVLFMSWGLGQIMLSILMILTSSWNLISFGLLGFLFQVR